MSLLSADDILALRREWLQDQVDLHPEFGTSPEVETAATAGASTLALRSLGVGTIRRGAAFFVINTFRRDRYDVIDAVTIVAGKATVTISPLLQADVAVAQAIQAEPYFRSAYNNRTHQLYFQDVQLEDFAAQVTEGPWAARVASATDPKRELFRAIRVLAWRDMLGAASRFVEVILQDDPRGNAKEILDRMDRQLRQDEAAVQTHTGLASSFQVLK